MRILRTAVFVITGLCAPGVLLAQQSSECVVSLTASAPGSTISRGGRAVSAVADTSGFCTFTLDACVNDSSIAGCTAGTVNKFRILGMAGSGNLATLQQTVQSQLPADHQVCAQTTLKVAQTQRKTVRAAARATDGRLDADTLALVCQCPSDSTPFASTFQGVQKVIFENHGCTQEACHGAAAQGGLNLSPDVAYSNLFEAPSIGSTLKRVQPGDKDRSFLWLKLAAKTDPSQLPPDVFVSGAPMPNNLPAISPAELELVRLWIYAGAPQSGTVQGTQAMLNACLAPPEPLIIKPLEAPTPGTGIQFVMPPWHLEAHSEHEICFATYYDLTDQVPKQYQDPTGTLFRFSFSELRQDPQSHHLILNRYAGPASDIHDPSIGAWTCNGGDKAGQTCEPTDLTSCGTGICTSEIKQSFACIGFGPQTGGQTYYAIGGAQQAQSKSSFASGVFAQIPMKGILYWNSHAFNLTDEDTTMHARLNYLFASDSRFPVQGIFDTSKIFAMHAPPFKRETVCNDYVLPQGTRLFNLVSHTHHHGKHFTVTGPNNALLYENFVYNDPADIKYDPPLAFDAPNPSDRTLHYCSLYDNGCKTANTSTTACLTADDPPDTDLVTRYSRLPQSAKISIGNCSPVACAAGKVGAPCRGTNDNHTCDSAPGANDGLCDACSLTGGESTQNEMFILIGSYYIDPSVAGTAAGLTDTSGRSNSSEVVLPPQLGCTASHAAHAAHAHH